MAVLDSRDAVEIIGMEGAIALIENLQASIEKPQALLSKVANLYKLSVEKSFQEQRSPGGKPWAKLAPATIYSRQRRNIWNGQMLEATGAGRRSITVVVRAKSVTISFLAYMDFHQRGEGIPQRQFAPKAEDFVQGAFAEMLNALLAREFSR